MYNGEEDYESFIKRIASNTQLLKVIDYWDYLSGLSNRYFISRTLQLANNNLPIEQYQQELDCLDRQFQSVAIIDNNILKDSIKHFFPEAYYWWYYQISKDIFLYGRDF
jgi:hypothetical protein